MRSLVWYVAAGSAVGGVARFLLGTAIQQRTGMAMPIGTLVVNISGSLLLGFLMRLSLESAAITPELRTLLTTGFCGGYTTFSTFSYETAALMEEGDYRRAAIYVALSVLLSLAGAFVGVALARELVAARRGG